MKKLYLIPLCIILFSFSNYASAQILDKVKNKVKQRVDQKVDQAIDKELDKAENSTKPKDENSTGTGSGSNADVKNPGLKSYSKYDFVPGDKIVYAEDFSQDAIGEFPLKWNTNGAGEVVTLEDIPGKWLKITESTIYNSPYNSNLPENYTIEFDLLTEFKDDQRVPFIKLLLQSDKATSDYFPQTIEVNLQPNNGTSVEDNGDGISFATFDGKGNPVMEGKKQTFGTFNTANHKNVPIHVSMWVQKQRVRVWVNQDKMYDLPKGIGENVKLKKLGFETTSYGGPKSNYSYFISNIKIAVAAPDTRSKLITEGKWSTTGILFDPNSDKIKAFSYGTLKEIAKVLSENADVKVKVIGHTDSDGDDARNMELSKKRAAAVKEALAKEFNVDASRMVTDGVGETKPVADNKTSEGKAQNRRVEFVKL
jgi:OmpA-OmpF porin, OOP family